MKVLLILIALLVLPLSASWGIDAYPAAEFGALFPGHDGSAEFSYTAGAKILLAENAASFYRLYNYSGVSKTNFQDIEGGTFFLLTEKYFPIKNWQLYVTMGPGILYQVTNGENPVYNDLKLAVGGRIPEVLTLELGVNYIPKTGSDWVNLYVGVNMMPFLK